MKFPLFFYFPFKIKNRKKKKLENKESRKKLEQKCFCSFKRHEICCILNSREGKKTHMLKTLDNNNDAHALENL